MCSLFRSFLDHLDRYFVKRHGENSSVYKNWKASLSREYDMQIAYSVVYGMRNFIQHYDMPPLNLRVHQESGTDGINVKIALSVKGLLRDKKFAEKFAGRIDVVEEGLPLYRIIDEWSSSFMRIVESANAIRAQDALQPAKFVQTLRSKFGIPPGGRIAIVRLPDANPDVRLEKLNMHLDWIDERKAQELIDNHENRSPAAL